MAKITAEVVREIRQHERPNSYFMEKYGITYANIWAVRKRLSWRHID